MNKHTRRVVFTAPLSAMAHRLHAATPVRSWLAFGEGSDSVTLIANLHTETDWRFAALQAVHELVEASLHHHARVTRAHLDAHDLATFDAAHSADAMSPAHSLATGIEHWLQRRIGPEFYHYLAVTRGPLYPVGAAAPIRRPPEEERAIQAIMPQRRRV